MYGQEKDSGGEHQGRATGGVPVVDVSALVTGSGDQLRVGREINQACRETGFFYIRGHGIPVTHKLKAEADMAGRLADKAPDTAPL